MALDDLRSEIAAAAQGAKHDQLLSVAERDRLVTLPISEIQEDPGQPRKDLGDLEEMAASIREHGVLQPIVVAPIGPDGYRLVVGERRLSASRLAGLRSIPCIIRTVEEHKKLEIQVIENIHRKAFTAVEEARAYQRLIEEHKYRHEDLAKALGKSRTSVTQSLAILKLPSHLLTRAEKHPTLTSSVLLEVAKEEGALQEKMMDAALRGEATVRSLRAVKASARRGEAPPPPVVAFAAEEARVTVRLPAEGCTWRNVIAGLRAALKQAEAELKESLEKQYGDSASVVGSRLDPLVAEERRGFAPGRSDEGS
jgi:ParB family transcriptional regulator, chromosome partitioning protein